MAEFTIADIVKRRRDLKEEFDREAKALTDRYKPKIDTLDKYLQKYLIDNKIKSQSTEYGTVLTYQRRNVTMANLDELREWCKLNGKEEFIKESVDSTEVLAYLDADAKHILPDGLKMDSTNVLSIKAPS